VGEIQADNMTPDMGTASLLDLVVEERPGTQIETTVIGKSLLIGFRHGVRTLWIALDKPTPTRVVENVEEILGFLANQLVLCQNCKNTFSAACICCHYEHRVMARRLREFLGESGYQRFLAHAPLVVGHRGG
jgi:hypothetical protein